MTTPCYIQLDTWLYSRTSIIRISIIQTLGYPNTIVNVEISRNPKRQLSFLHNQVINGLLVLFLDLLGLLYHSTVDKKDILQMQYYRPPTQLINQNILCIAS